MNIANATTEKKEVPRAPASAVQTSAVYVKSGAAVIFCSNRYCDEPSYIQTNNFFGMSEAVDSVIATLDRQKLYSCTVRGVPAGNFLKVYEMSNCAELNQRKFLEAINDLFGGGRQ